MMNREEKLIDEAKNFNLRMSRDKDILPEYLIPMDKETTQNILKAIHAENFEHTLSMNLA